MGFEQDLLRQLAALARRLERLETQERGGVWTDWTPTITQSGSVTVTVTFARYCTDGNKVDVEVRLAVTGTGTTNNAIVIAGIPAAIQPANSASASHVVGNGVVIDTGTATYEGSVVAFGADDLRFTAHNTAGYIGQAPNFALANGDFIGFTAKWER